MTGAGTALTAVAPPAVRAARAGWTALAAGAVLLAGLAVARLPRDAGTAAEAGFVLVWTAASALVVRRSRTPVAVCAGVFLVAFPLMFTGVATDAVPGAPELAAGLDVLGGASFLLFAFTFPDGRFSPSWTRWLALGWTAALVLDQVAQTQGAVASATVSAVRNTGWLLSLASAVAVQVHRYRHVSTARQRDQAKWVSYGTAVAVGGFVLAIAAEQVGVLGPPERAEAVVTPLAYAFVSVLPVCLAIAVLRHRLWDIDLLVNRTLVYLLLSAIALVACTLAVTAVGLAVGGDLGRAALPTSAATIALLAVALHPVHARVQRLVNRLLYGRRDDPYSVLAELGQRLATTTSPDGVLPIVVATTAAALRLPYVAITLGAAGVAAAAGAPGPTTASWPLEHEGATVGQLVASPRRGDTFTDADRRLLADLAARAGAAVHAVGLAHDLERARAGLVLAREEERRRLHRDLHDHLGATLGALTLKAGAAGALLHSDLAAAADAIGEVERELQGSVAEVRRLVYALRPPALDDRGLAAAVADLAPPRSALAVELEVVPASPWPPLPAAVELAAYRITQEALANAARHSGARCCRVRLALAADGATLAVEVSDDGRGLPPRVRRGVGLDSMQERAAELGGHCAVGTSPAGGVRVAAVLPLAPGAAR